MVTGDASVPCAGLAERLGGQAQGTSQMAGRSQLGSSCPSLRTPRPVQGCARAPRWPQGPGFNCHEVPGSRDRSGPRLGDRALPGQHRVHVSQGRKAPLERD